MSFTTFDDGRTSREIASVVHSNQQHKRIPLVAASTMAPNANESYCTFTLPTDVTAGGLVSFLCAVNDRLKVEIMILRPTYPAWLLGIQIKALYFLP
jgi:hypothetical protein